MKQYFQRYGITCMIGLVILVLMMPVSVVAAGEDPTVESRQTENNMTEFVAQLK